jgi:hypothetical protein
MDILLVIMALSSGPNAAAAQAGNAPFCLQTSAGARCSYSTMGDCERARGDAPATQCISQADARGATGLGKPTIPVPASPPSLER